MSARGWIVGMVLSTLLSSMVGMARWRVRHPVEWGVPPASMTLPPMPSLRPPSTSAPPPSMSVSATPLPPPSKVPRLERPLRVSAYTWESASAIVLANAGLRSGPNSAYVSNKLILHARAAEGMGEIERALARGGNEETGIDIAIAPLPWLIASYERLRALKLQVFYVVGWSYGREGLFVRKGDTAFEGTSDETRLFTTGGDSSVSLALFAADAEGLPLTKIRTTSGVKAADIAAEAKPFTALTAPEGPNEPRFTTLDASRLVPIVAVASSTFLESYRATVVDFARITRRAIADTAADVPSAARKLAPMTGVMEPATLLERLGSLQFANLRDNARVFELHGLYGASLRTLVARNFELFHGTGAIHVTQADHILLRPDVVVQLGSGDPEIAPEPHVNGAPVGEARKVMVTRFAEKISEDLYASELALLAEIFPRAHLRLGLGKTGSFKHVVELAKSRYGVDVARLVTGAVVERATMSIEVFVPK